LRTRADAAYVLSVAHGSCRNGGWVHMWEQDGQPEERFQWELRERGVLRSRADPRYALCVTQNGCRDGGWVHLWELGDEEADIFSQWIIHDGELRAKADPRYSLCVRRDGCTNGGYLHMWAFGGPPDVYGQWEIVMEEQDAECGRRPSCTGSEGSGPHQEPCATDASGALEPAVQHLRAALVVEEGEKVLELRRAPLIAGLEAFGQALNKVGGGMGTYLLSEVDKFRRSQAKSAEEDYRPWLLSEMPVHAATDYESFVEDSACMANLSAARALEFYAQFLALLRDGLETSTGLDMAYRKTLQNHHDLFQRLAFSTAARQLPCRQRLLQQLEGGGGQEATGLARRVVHFCLQVDQELQAKMQESRQRLEMDRAYGRAAW